MDELDLLLLSPYRDITERAKAAIENAKNAGDRAPPLMLKSAEKLLKESERALKEIEPLSTNHYEQYGSVFVDTTKNHDEIARWRYELEELLWDFDDYIKVEDFNAAKFDALEKLSKRAALKTIDILKRLRVGEVLNNTPSVDKSVENPHEGHYKLSGSAAQGERIPTQLFSRLQRSGRPEFPGGCTASRPQSTPPSTLTPTYPRASKASSPSYQNYMYPEPPENSESSTKNLSSDAINRSDLSNTRFSEGLIPVALSDFEATSYVPLQEPDCTITASSSFRMLNGFCEGAKEAQRGQLGFKRLKRGVDFEP
ncbi:hypothetical protein F5Y09DRAFT_130040 [Xylaria sp. FL1042]|nr:hypothetical protein F5Y09DRAFT_130040 [Xylaria sp. FL1042]